MGHKGCSYIVITGLFVYLFRSGVNLAFGIIPQKSLGSDILSVAAVVPQNIANEEVIRCKRPFIKRLDELCPFANF